VTNGLLGPGPSPRRDGLSSGFVSNGLLGGLGTSTVPAPEGRASSLQTIIGGDVQIEPEPAEWKSSFQPNGLLGSQPGDADQHARRGMAPLTSSSPTGTYINASGGTLYESQGRAIRSFAS
jgi:hypothetical protein